MSLVVIQDLRTSVANTKGRNAYIVVCDKLLLLAPYVHCELIALQIAGENEDMHYRGITVHLSTNSRFAQWSLLGFSRPIYIRLDSASQLARSRVCDAAPQTNVRSREEKRPSMNCNPVRDRIRVVYSTRTPLRAFPYGISCSGFVNCYVLPTRRRRRSDFLENS